MSSRIKSYIYLHIAVFLFGFTAILGKQISLSAISLVWHRMWMAAFALLFVPKVWRGIKKIQPVDKKRFILIGILIAIHWITFYGSIKLGNSASLTLACLSTVTLFTSFLEPWLTKTKFQWVELVIGLIIILGILLIAQMGKAFYQAIWVGLLSALFAALFSTLNKKYIKAKYNALSISSLELFAGWVFLVCVTPLLDQSFYNQFTLPKQDIPYLLILAILCTSLAFVLSVIALKDLSAFTSNLAINLEPVYGILLAGIIFKENKELASSFYWGTGIILIAVFIHPILLRFQKSKINQRVHS